MLGSSGFEMEVDSDGDHAVECCESKKESTRKKNNTRLHLFINVENSRELFVRGNVKKLTKAQYGRRVWLRSCIVRNICWCCFCGLHEKWINKKVARSLGRRIKVKLEENKIDSCYAIRCTEYSCELVVILRHVPQFAQVLAKDWISSRIRAALDKKGVVFHLEAVRRESGILNWEPQTVRGKMKWAEALGNAPGRGVPTGKRKKSRRRRIMGWFRKQKKRIVGPVNVNPFKSGSALSQLPTGESCGDARPVAHSATRNGGVVTSPRTPASCKLADAGSLVDHEVEPKKKRGSARKVLRFFSKKVSKVKGRSKRALSHVTSGIKFQRSRADAQMEQEEAWANVLGISEGKASALDALSP